jgi:hypothetical protein
LDPIYCCKHPAVLPPYGVGKALTYFLGWLLTRQSLIPAREPSSANNGVKNVYK